MSSTSETPNLTGEEASIVFGLLNPYFNETILQGLIHGIYTCIFAITLWITFSNHASKSSTSRVLMVFVIVLLYLMTTISFALLWFYVRFGFIDNGQDALSVFTALTSFNSQWTMTQIGVGVTGTINTVISDGTLIWRCFTVWGDRWLIVIFPILCLITETIAKCLQVYQNYNEGANRSQFTAAVDWTMIYLSLVLTTTLTCTLLIVYRILSVKGIKTGLRSYRGIVEVVAAEYNAADSTLIVYIAFISRNTLGSAYIDVFMTEIKGITPTLIVGRVAAGHARPNDTWKESRLSSLHFGNSERAQMSTTGGVTQSVNLPDEEVDTGSNTSSDRGIMPEAKSESA
ncbi:hypothetical protein ARMSODRAFT_1024198 [Armillaria solidipes]|uniref:Uncharacterized protein n=1 Tax=Armillaria solidipes TaxID=1076256 RepID=A0A2H3BJD0_9AGAR|nr:hypothetical protein ARMSODRAFT_1024198 [Armillaria solidipes]